MAKLSAVGMTGEVTLHDDGTVTVRLHGYSVPITVYAEHLSLIAKRKAEPGRRKPLFDKPDWSQIASTSRIRDHGIQQVNQDNCGDGAIPELPAHRKFPSLHRAREV